MNRRSRTLPNWAARVLGSANERVSGEDDRSTAELRWVSPIPGGSPARAGAMTLGVSVQGAVGYDFRFGGKFGLTPYAEYALLVGNRLEALTSDGRRRYLGPRLPSALQAGLSVNWY
jgi:hypothetical protein